MEKADILEMTVRHLKQHQGEQQQQETEHHFPPHQQQQMLSRYQTGFSECAREVSRCLDSMLDMNSAVKQRLVQHLTRCVQRISASSSSDTPSSLASPSSAAAMLTLTSADDGQQQQSVVCDNVSQKCQRSPRRVVAMVTGEDVKCNSSLSPPHRQHHHHHQHQQQGSVSCVTIREGKVCASSSATAYNNPYVVIPTQFLLSPSSAAAAAGSSVVLSPPHSMTSPASSTSSSSSASPASQPQSPNTPLSPASLTSSCIIPLYACPYPDHPRGDDSPLVTGSATPSGQAILLDHNNNSVKQSNLDLRHMALPAGRDLMWRPW